MKRITALFAAFVLLLCALTACGEKEITCTQQTVSGAEEQEELTGIRLYAPIEAENPEWLVITGSDGSTMAQVDFDYNGEKWHYRAEKTDKTEDYNFSGLNYDWTDEGSWGIDDLNGYAYACEKGGYLGWIDLERGIAYNVFSDTATIESLWDVAYAAADAEFFQNGSDEPYVDDGEWTVAEPTPADLIVSSVWKYDNYDAYIQVLGNRTYFLYGADRENDGKVRFWKKLSDNTILLYNEFGGEDTTLKCEGEWDSCIVTDEAGDTLHRFDEAMNGTYYCMMNDTYIDGDDLTLTAALDYWLSDYEVSQLAAGSVINNTDVDFMAINVTAVEKKSDAWYVITDDTDTQMDLKRDEAAGAWKLEQDTPSWERIGLCKLKADTVFTDTADSGEHTSLAECMAVNDFVYANVTVEDGTAVSIDVINIF